jgi:hypothetical protein
MLQPQRQSLDQHHAEIDKVELVRSLLNCLS